MAKFVDIIHKTTSQKIWINRDHVIRWTRSLRQRSGISKVEKPAPSVAVIVPKIVG
jgi:hypothetical protein